jgi:hypothetical protein
MLIAKDIPGPQEMRRKSHVWRPTIEIDLSHI